MTSNIVYLEDYSNEDIIDNIKNYYEKISDDNKLKETKKNKPSISLKPDYNSKGEKVVIFSIKIPIKKDSMTIDILINNEMYENIGKHF
jgi:hypothetical protein